MGEAKVAKVSVQAEGAEPVVDEVESLADFSLVDGRKKVKWALKEGEGNEFFMYLKDIDAYRPPLHDILRELLPHKSGDPFDFLELPPEVQLEILDYLSLRDLNSCRLTCRWINDLIEKNWHSLSPRKIGSIDFIPGCDEVWGLYFNYKRKLRSFTNVIISRLVLFYGVITSSILSNLAHTLRQSRITVKAIVIHNCLCSCEPEELIAFIKSAHVESLAIDVYDMGDFGKRLLNDPAIQRLRCVFIFSNGDDIMSGIMVDPFLYDMPIDLHGVCRLLADWESASMEILHFHMYSDAEWAADADSVLNAVQYIDARNGYILRNIDEQELRVEVSDGCITFALSG
ncbi:unnamed protein product [Cylicocyclus nassatus]|uniref:F-box domain-containing protein n=1 Tax=Cylicocyclus nassatus TaxID=53992 RepID=A0AA36M8C1_CYLNA|nr:unnamed protein product [Cylicocyclus nassatus]